MFKKMLLFCTIFIAIVLTFSFNSYGVTKVELSNDICIRNNAFYLSEKYVDNFKQVSFSNSYIDNIYVKQLWDKSVTGNFVFSLKINNDNIPDILVSSYVINGINGEVIYQFEAGEIICIGDIDNDNIDEIITYKDGKNHNYNSTIYCLDSSNGQIIWSKFFNSAWVYHVSIGDIKGDTNKEIILCLGDIRARNNHYIYCLDGMTGDIEWRKWTDGYPLCCEVSDVNDDGKNEVIASTDGTVNSDELIGYLYCLDENGNELWNISKKLGVFRHFCIDDLNDDNYKEILTENLTWNYDLICLSGFDGSVLWTYEPESYLGSFQCIRTADLISGFPGKEIIVGGVPGVFCLKSGDYQPDREIWSFLGNPNDYTTFFMSIAIGDIDRDGLLDVAGITFRQSSEKNGRVIALNGQDGSLLWKFEDCGIDSYESSIICLDLTGDSYDEVVAKDKYYICALVTSGGTENNPPNKPNKPTGDTSGRVGVSYSYSTSTVDPENDSVFYWWDWGDGSNSGWLGPYILSEECNVSHQWAKKGHYNIKVKAKDLWDAESNWSDALDVIMPKDKQVVNNIYLKALERLLNIFPTLKNILVRIFPILSFYF